MGSLSIESNDNIKEIIDKTIEKFVPRRFSENSTIFKLSPPRYSFTLQALTKAISEPIWEFLDRGGKRWRPKLFLLICEALGEDPKNFIDFATIPEVIHNGTLMIDDIEDQSSFRRGKPCTYKTFGLDIAINAGNAMYYLPLLSLVENQERFPSKILNKAYETYLKEMINLSLGQAMDIAWHKGLADADSLKEQDYFQMCAYKTGTLARISAKLAAILSEADEHTIEELGYFAESIGVAFQIQDDILDLKPGDFAKRKGARGMDISEGKRSLIVIHTLQNATSADRKRLVEILRMHTSQQSLREEAIRIIEKYDSIKYAKDYAVKIVTESWNKIDNILPPSDAKNQLRNFAKYLVERKI